MSIRPSWDQYFLDICETVSKRSLDENTKLGCVITNDKHVVISTGYNSLPAGIKDDFWPMEREKKILLHGFEINKYDVVTHAEANAICSAAALGVSTRDCILYCTYLPCAECAKLVISARIKKIIFSKENPRFEKSHVLAKEMFKQAGIEFVNIDKISI
jgi:dCMP deaminase